MFNIVLMQPEIPPNTGNIIRLAANTGCNLHLIEPLGFELSDKHLRRAGLDYHEYAPVVTHPQWQAFVDVVKPNPARIFAMTTKGSTNAFNLSFAAGDTFVFGCETRGLPADFRHSFPPQQRIRLPMRPEQRSLNLANSVAIIVYEAWRQCGFVGVEA